MKKKKMVFPIHKNWCTKIFEGSKLAEFRNRLPKGIKPGDVIYIYETRSSGGSGKVIGKFKVSRISNNPKLFDNGNQGYDGQAFGILIDKPKKFWFPKDISKYGLKHAPQNFAYVRK